MGIPDDELNMNSAFYFYYHEETMVYSAMALAFFFGVFHELKGGWLSNDILAFSSVYVLVARCQAIGLRIEQSLANSCIHFSQSATRPG